MRRIIAVAEAANTFIEFAPDFATFKLKYPDIKNATIVLSKEQCTDDLETFREQRNLRVIAWDEMHSSSDPKYSANTCQCIGDPFSLNNYQAAVNLISYAPSERQWIKQHKWGSLVQNLKLDMKNSQKEFKTFTDQLKLTNHPNMMQWQALMNTLIKAASPHHAPSLYMNCDGNKLKMHIVMGGIPSAVLWTKIASAKKLYDSMVRFDVAEGELTICSEISIGVSGRQIPAAILIVHASQQQPESAPSSLEDAG